MVSEMGDLCRKTVDVLEERGMVAGVLKDAAGRVCLVGGLQVALGDEDWVIRDSVRSVAYHIGKRLADLGFPVERGHESLQYWPADFSNALVEEGRVDEILHALKLAAESFDADGDVLHDLRQL